jgi:DNA-binding MarR family transcriptional regulator
MTSTSASFFDWVSPDGDEQEGDLQRYFRGVAKARYVIRKVFRIVDEEAKRAGLEGLQHQAMIQIFGVEGAPLRVNDLAERLDIAPAFASRLIRELVDKGFVTRTVAPQDRRVMEVGLTEEGRGLLRKIDSDVHVHVEYFQRQLTDDERAAALGIFTFYVGASLDEADSRRLRQIFTRSLQSSTAAVPPA